MVSANNDVPVRRGDDSILPIASQLSEPSGGKAWIVAGVCALAFSVLFSVKVKPVEPSAPVEPEWAASPPAAAAEPAPPEPAPPAVAKDEAVNKVLEQAMPLVNGAAQAPAAAEEVPAAPAAQVQPTETKAPAAPVQSTWALHKARREERQRAGHEFTLALNLGTAAGQEPAQRTEPPVTAPSAPAEPVAAAPVMVTEAPAPKSPIPDNPY